VNLAPQAGAGDRGDAFARADAVEHFGATAGVAVKLDPRDDEIVGGGIAGQGGSES
jgi:hypothetical protein